MTDTYSLVVSVLCDLLHLEPHEIRPGLALVDDLGADSLDLTAIGVDLEVLCELPETDIAPEMASLRTVADLTAYFGMRRLDL